MIEIETLSKISPTIITTISISPSMRRDNGTVPRISRTVDAGVSRDPARVGRAGRAGRAGGAAGRAGGAGERGQVSVCL